MLANVENHQQLARGDNTVQLQLAMNMDTSHPTYTWPRHICIHHYTFGKTHRATPLVYNAQPPLCTAEIINNSM
jgi:hypothetical protein